MIIPHQIVDECHPRILHILNNEFHENCVLHSVPDPQFKGEFCYRAKKTKEARQAELKLHTATKPLIVSLIYQITRKDLKHIRSTMYWKHADLSKKKSVRHLRRIIT